MQVKYFESFKVFRLALQFFVILQTLGIVIVVIGLMFTGLFHYFTPEVKLSPTQKSSSFVYERLKPDRTNPVQANTDFTVNTDSELTDKPCTSYNTRSLHNGDMDRQIVEQDECRDRQIAPEEEYHDGRKKISWKDWLKEPQFYQVSVFIWKENSVCCSF